MRPADYSPATGAGAILGKVLLFCLGMVLVFTLIANLLPQVEGEAPEEKTIDLGALTLESYIAMGETLFSGKGNCALCHNAMGRAPDILALNMVETAARRLKEPRYRGKATDAESYLRESLVDPGAYVVKGFGKKGSNDTVSPMPAVDKPPIELSAVEINAVIAYLQAKDGGVVTVPLPGRAPAQAAPGAAGAADTAPIPSDTAEAVAAKYGCQACHKVQGNGGDIGPDLTGVGQRLTPEQIRQSIIDPDAVVAEGFPAGLMAQDFAAQMTVRELETLVKFLTESKS